MQACRALSRISEREEEMNKLLPRLRKRKLFECEYEKCHRKMASREARNLHHIKCKKRTDSDEDSCVYELSLAFVPPKQRETVSREPDYCCQYELCDRTFKAPKQRNRHMLKCKKRTAGLSDQAEFQAVMNRLYGKEPRDVSMRQVDKTLNFAKNYGVAAEKIVSVDMAEIEKRIAVLYGWEVLAEDRQRNCLIVKVPLGDK